MQSVQGDALGEGRVGIGATNPRAKLHVVGDARVDGGNLILQSPDGSYWNISVDNSGTLSATAAGSLESGTADAAYEAAVAATGALYDNSKEGTHF